MSKYVRGTEHISEELARFIGRTLGIVAVGAEALLKDWFEIYSQKVRFCPVCGRRLAID